MLLRRIMAVDGDARVHVDLEPRAEYGAEPLAHIELDAGVWTARTGRLRLRWQGAPNATVTDGRVRRRLHADLTVPAGSHHDLVLEIRDGRLADSAVDAEDAWRVTEATWDDEVPDLAGCLTPREASHTYAVLRGLTSSSGGMVAAATSSLPERAQAGRNYDYRYVWIRDQCYAGHAFAAIGDPRLLREAARFVAHRFLEDGDRMAPAYTATGKPIPDQVQLQLPGYPGGFDRSATGSINSFSSTRSARRSCYSPTRPDSTPWTPILGGRPLLRPTP